MSEELNTEKVTLPSGQEVVLKELTGKDLLGFMDEQGKGKQFMTMRLMVACCHAPQYTEEELLAMRASDFMPLVRHVNRISGMVEADPTSDPETSS